MKKIIQIQITVGFSTNTNTVCWKKGIGETLSAAVRNLFDRKYNYIKKDEMTLVYKELIKTKAKAFKQ